jgi:hypothetical protein
MKNLDSKYKTQKEELITQIYIYMPQQYNSKIIALKCQEKSPNLEKVKKDFHSKWEKRYGRKGDEDTKREGQ